MKAIGIGCFWFARRGGEPEDSDTFSAPDHIKAIKEALEGIDNISNVQIHTPRTSIGVNGSLYAEEEEVFFPIFSRASITFTIYIPERLIKKFQPGFSYDSVEQYAVHIIYGGAMPVTYVHYDMPGGEVECPEYSP